jgi:GNAT superfamily N-acetyltransferase
MAGGPVLRVATLDDASTIDALMKASIAGLFPAFHDDAQVRSSIKYIGAVDRMLLEDGTYFVIEDDGDVVACGGWSRRDKLYSGSGEGADDARLLDPANEPARIRAMFVRPDRTRRGLGTMIMEAAESAARAEGFRTMALMSTLPGLPLYERVGFVVDAYVPIQMPDGTSVGGAEMSKPIA